MNIRHNEPLREKLAAEYVLGTLKGSARRRFEHWLKNDAALRRAVAEWQDRLHPMAEFAPAVQPPPAVWRAIEQHLDLAHPQKSFWSRLRENLSFWRGLGLTSTAIATVLVVVLLTREPTVVAPAATYIATLADDKAQPAMIITGDAKRRQLVIKVIAPQNLATDKSLELWAVPKQGSPRSLGLVANRGVITLPLPENATPESIPLLAVSLEPKGGSPNRNAPTGPILFKGAWVQI
ncbi:MAG: anti-sigma factor [Burkholderiales bacterium]|nr:anti-sigma factor [Burkholderiales bacterium]